MDDKVQAFYTIIKLTVAIVLFSHTLPHRERLGLRISFVAVGAALVSFAGFSSGFTMYPPLTDFSSYLIGILSFLVVLSLMLVGQLTIYRNSLLCSLFCCSMAYSLENFSSEVERCVAMIFQFPSYPPPIVLGSLRYWIVSSVIFLVGNTVLIRRIEKSGLRQIDDPAMVLALVLAIMVNMVFDLIVKELGVSDIAVHFIVLLNVVYLSLCVFIMYAEFEIVYNRRLEIGIAAEKELREAQTRQYDLTLSNIEAINAKCHAIRHRIYQLEEGSEIVSSDELAELAQEISIYDTKIKTGNDALDVVIAERGLVCEQWGIVLACIADGSALDFVDSPDLQPLVGGILGAATAVVRGIESRDARRISLHVGANMGMTSVHVECPCAHQFDLGDDPVGSESSRDLRAAIDRYEGILSSKVVDGTYHLNVLLPRPHGRGLKLD